MALPRNPITKDVVSLMFLTDAPLIHPKELYGANCFFLSLQEIQAAETDPSALHKAFSTRGKPEGITTPWVVFLEQDEFLSSQDLRSLVEYCSSHETVPIKIQVERRVAPEVMADFGWVTTWRHLKKPADNIRKYATIETRIFPTTMLGALSIGPSQSGICEARFSIHIRSTEAKAEDTCPAVISRFQENATNEENLEPVPADRDIFRYGHETYFNDKVISERFEWPHTSYHTIRYDHVPAIKEALQQGLSTARIITYTLLYLLRFRHFKEASELIQLIPEHWYFRYPDLANGTAACYFAGGHGDKALALYERVLRKTPDSDWIAKNAVKMNILTGRYEAIDAIFNNYHNATGKQLTDEYYERFKAVHGEAPLRTATLSACFIVRDEEKSLERAITSIKPMADEIVVVDTGSCDRSKEIAVALGAHVYDFPWSDDFSAARNFAISKATCDYIFMMDADEYLSPFFFIECQSLKKLFPLTSPCAYSIDIGRYFNETDWYFIVSEAGNFRVETTAVRIFPRSTNLTFSGRIAESIEPALAENRVPISAIPNALLQIIHVCSDRKARIERKVLIYKKMDRMNEVSLLSAIRDFSAIGCAEETAGMLKNLYDSQIDGYGKTKLGLYLAGILSSVDMAQANLLYLDLITRYPESVDVVLAYATFLMTNNRIHEIAGISFENVVSQEKIAQTELRCLQSLKDFEAGEEEKALESLIAVLEDHTLEILPQALRFYYMSSLNNIEGVVAALDNLLTLTAIQKNLHIEKIEDLLQIIEELCKALIKGKYPKEGALLLHGMTKLGNAWGVI